MSDKKIQLSKKKKRRVKNKINKIRKKRTYTVKTASEVMNRSERTILDWIRKRFIKPISLEQRPYFILGAELYEFEKKRRANRKVKLKDGEFYCLSCKKATTSIPEKIKVMFQRKKIGNNDNLVVITGICNKCSSKLYYRTTRKHYEIKKEFYSQQRKDNTNE